MSSKARQKRLQQAVATEALDPAPTGSPYHWALPREEGLADPELLRLSFHTDSVVLTDFSEADYVRTRLVSALELSQALAAELDTNTGILSGDGGGWNTLWHARTIGGLNLGLYVPATVRTIALSRDWEHDDALVLPWPPLVFVALPGRRPGVFACAERPQTEEAQLYHCPSYNVFASGRICVGSARFPERPALLPAAFFGSRFSRAMDTAGGKSHRHPEDIGQLWSELAGTDTFPVDDLVPALRVRDAMQIGE